MGCKLERGCQYPPDATSLLSEDLIVCPLHPREEPHCTIYTRTIPIFWLCAMCRAMHNTYLQIGNVRSDIHVDQRICGPC